jgi:hypothetical protein
LPPAALLSILGDKMFSGCAAVSAQVNGRQSQSEHLMSRLPFWGNMADLWKLFSVVENPVGGRLLSTFFRVYLNVLDEGFEELV